MITSETLEAIIKKNVPAKQYLTQSDGKLYYCPFCGSKNSPEGSGTLEYYQDKNTVFCHQCEKTGDVLDVFTAVQGGTRPEAVKKLSAFLGYDTDGIRIDEYKKEDPAGVKAFLKEIYSDRYRPTETGLAVLDNILCGGLLPQSLVILSGETGTGKTALSAMIAESMATRGKSCLFFNLEMSREQLIARSISRRIYARDSASKLTARQILQGYERTEKEKGLIETAAAEYERETGGRVKYNPGTAGTDLDGILDYIGAAADQAKAAGDPAPNICIDYLQLLTGKRGEDVTGTIKKAVAGFKDYAIKNNAIVLCITANRRPQNGQEQTAASRLHAGRDSSAIEYSADLLLHLEKTDAQNPEAVTLFVVKSRFSEANPAEGRTLTFHGGQAFFEMGAEWQPADNSAAPFDFEKTHLV